MFEVRQYEARDEQGIVALWREVLPDPAPHNDPAVSLARKLAEDPDLLFVADSDGEIVGAVMGGYDGHRGWIYSLAVAPDRREEGIGRALVERVERALAECGCPKLNLQVRADNAGVVAFYEKLGFVVEERISLGKRLG